MTDFSHWSDCAIYNAPALSTGPCDCGGLDLAAYARYRDVTALIPNPRGLTEFLSDEATARFVQTEQLPTDVLPADTATADLPSAHDRIAVSGRANGVDFDQSAIAVVLEGEAPTGIQSVTSNVPPHKQSPDSASGGVIAPKTRHGRGDAA
jgi:hypothetical protein